MLLGDCQFLTYMIIKSIEDWQLCMVWITKCHYIYIILICVCVYLWTLKAKKIMYKIFAESQLFT